MADTGYHGRKLVEYLETRRGLESMRQFAANKGIDHASVSRWKHSDPGIENLRQVADAMGLTLGEILIITGYGTAADFGGVAAPLAEAPSVDRAIDHDPTLSASEREGLRVVLNAMRGMTHADGQGPRGGKRTIRAK